MLQVNKKYFRTEKDLMGNNNSANPQKKIIILE